MRLTLNFNVFIYDDRIGDDDNLEYYKFVQI